MAGRTTPRRFTRRLLERLAKVVRRKVKPLIPSRTLREALRIRLFPDKGQAFVEIPHYWAVYIHDGRGVVTKRRGFLVFFRDPRDDPRTGFGRRHPVRARDRKKLTKAQFQHGMKENRRLFLQNPEGGTQQFMIVTKLIGPMRGKPFFDIGMAGFGAIADRIVLSEMDRWMREMAITDRQTAVARI